MKSTSANKLHDRHERVVARIAMRAICDTINGGAAAIVLSNRLHSMGGQDVRHVVSDVYSASTGRAHPLYSPWECPECGSVHLGQDSARQCCAFDADDYAEAQEIANENLEPELA